MKKELKGGEEERSGFWLVEALCGCVVCYRDRVGLLTLFLKKKTSSAREILVIRLCFEQGNACEMLLDTTLRNQAVKQDKIAKSLTATDSQRINE